MKKKLLFLAFLVFALSLVLTVGVSASETEDLTALKITPGRTVSVTLPEGVGNYTYNEDIVILKGFSTNEEGETTLLFACKADIPMGTYDLLYINGESSMGISVYGMGDANMDGDVSARDVVLIKQAIVGMTELSGTQRVFSNVYDEDDEVNTRDAVLVLQHIVGMDVTLGTPDGDSAVCSGASLSIIDGYLYATYLDAPDTPINLGKVKGEDGVGIASIEKTSTEGLVDTYTITYTDGTTTTFTVTNGAQGIQGIQGVPGENGHTPVITIENGNWYVDGVDTGVAAQGPKGDTGDDGLSAFVIYQKYHPEYTGTEEEWLESLKGADGAQGEQGIGVADAYVDENYHLWIVLSNGTKIDAGFVGVDYSGTYTVTFLSEDGTELKKIVGVDHGATVAAPTVPQKEGYRFVGWDTDFSAVTSNLTVKPQYEIVHNQLLFKFEDKSDGTVTATLSLCGDVSLYGIEARLYLTTEGMSYTSVTAHASGLLANYNGEYIKLSFVSPTGKNVTEAVELLSVTFTVTCDAPTATLTLANVDVFDDGFANETVNVANNTYFTK